MELSVLRGHVVCFRGLPLSRRARGALSAAGISVLERQPAPQWGGQLQDFRVSVEARDPADAVQRVQAALERQGAYYSGWRAERAHARNLLHKGQ